MSTLMARMMGSSSSGISSSSSSSSVVPPPQPSLQSQPASLPLRSIPGSYGWPLLGAISDRLAYFWFEGPKTYFKKRIEKHRSTVFRTNVPPTFPFFLGVNPNVIAVLDVKSFSHLFDMELVDKANVLVGDFMPNTTFTGDLRVCAYLDTSEPKHAQIKKFSMDILKRSSKKWVPTMVEKLDKMWESIEAEVSKSGSTSYFFPTQKFLFNFLSICLAGADPSAYPEINDSGYILLNKWLAPQLLPTISINILQPLEEIFLHSFAYPFLIVKNDYKKLVEFVKKEGKETIEIGQKEFNLTEEEAIHNLLFFLGFNAYGGFSLFLPSLLTRLEDKKLQERLRMEVREKIGTDIGKLSFETVKEMELVQSVVYETLRLAPPVPSQFGRARKDFKLASHDSVFEIKKGELLCGYQPLVMKDSKVFDDPETFVADRFTKAKGGESLLNYLFWSNGPQTGTPTESNKQCAGKDIVTLTASLFVAYIFLRFDSVTISSGSIKGFKKADN